MDRTAPFEKNAWNMKCKLGCETLAAWHGKLHLCVHDGMVQLADQIVLLALANSWLAFVSH